MSSPHALPLADPAVRPVDGLTAFEADLLGESPVWHPREQALYWCDIPGHRVRRHDPATGAHRVWQFETDVACCAAMLDGGLLLAMRDGLWRIDPAVENAERKRLLRAPYDPAVERFNDGKTDPQGRFWAATIYEPRQPANAVLYRYERGRLTRQADGITTGNGLGWSPNGRTMYFADTRAHTVYAYDFELTDATLSARRTFAHFTPKVDGAPLDDYAGRPDGAAVDVEGCYWVAMFEGARLLRLSPEGELLRTLHLPVRCPTMPCFGGADLRTLYITTARENRPADELAAQPWAGRVLQLRVDVPGLPANLFRD